MGKYSYFTTLQITFPGFEDMPTGPGKVLEVKNDNVSITNKKECDK